jgi:hypothetical protein
LPDVVGKIAKTGSTSALSMQLLERKLPAGSLPSGVLTDDAIEPTLDAA